MLAAHQLSIRCSSVLHLSFISSLLGVYQFFTSEFLRGEGEEERGGTTTQGTAATSRETAERRDSDHLRRCATKHSLTSALAYGDVLQSTH